MTRSPARWSSAAGSPPRSRGRGWSASLCLETLRYAREDLLVHRVEWRSASENTRSRALATRLGFNFEGRLRDAGLHNGHRQHLDLLSLVGPEIDELLASRSGEATSQAA